MESDPGYLANLRALPTVDMERLLKGNWKIKATAGLFFQRTQIKLIETLPKDIILWVRGWDLAATDEDEEGDPAYTAGVLIRKTKGGRYVVADVINQRLSASKVRELIKITCKADKAKYGRVIERLPQDPGQAGKEQTQSYIKFLSGYLVKCIAESGSKESRAEPFAAQWQPGNVDVLLAPWNEAYFNQLESFPESKFKDMADASSSAFNEIENGATYSAPPSNSLGKSSYWRSK
ncbi:MAG: phage terminase large subunit [Clostridiales bacterium]|nr:phage terminase large subunit [Clostridiales bacterium]